MTCRQKLVLGLLVALSLSPAGGRFTYAASQPGMPAAAANGEVSEISLRRGTASASGAAATWKPSNFDGGTDIRFKKPGLIPSNATLPSAANQAPLASSALKKPITNAEPSNEPVIISDADSQSIDAKAIQANGPLSAEKSLNTAGLTFQPSSAESQNPTVRPLPGVAAAADPAIAQAIAAEKIEPSDQSQPASLASKLNLKKATAQSANLSADDAGRSEMRLTDEQLQQVPRISNDSQVMQAAEEEALPSSAASGEPASGADGTKRNVPRLDDEMYYGADCCPPQRRLFWTAGIEATFLNPDLNTDGVSVDVEEIDESRHDICTTLSNDIDSIYVSPRIWLGVQGCLWGTNLRYWHLQASEGSFDPSIGGLGSWDDFDCGVPDFGFMTCSRLEAYTVDLELTRRFCLNDCAMQAAVGLRHAEIENSDALWALANTDEGLLTGMARANRLSRGTGVMFGLYGRKPVYPCSCVHWFYNARWSALWGPTQTSVETFASVQTVADPNITGSAASVNGAYTNVDDTLFIGEIQLGLEWDYCLQCLPANAFFRAALEYQRWDGGKGFSQSQSFAGAEIISQVDPVSILTANAAASVPQLDLIGISLSTGLTW